MINIDQIRNDFPILSRKINGHQLVYLDNAATTHKPNSVIESISKYYSYYNSNVHRGIYKIAEKATHEFELTRDVVKDFIGSKNTFFIGFKTF